MKIHHIAIWTSRIEIMKDFYCKYFGCTAGEKYINQQKCFQSYFLRFDNDVSVELMNRLTGETNIDFNQHEHGLAHLAVSVGDKETVNRITECLGKAGYSIVSGPRYTGDGYYESCVLDPEGNRIEITI